MPRVSTCSTPGVTDQRLPVAALARPHQLYVVVALLQALDDAGHGQRDPIDLGRIGFGDHRHAQAAMQRRHVIDDQLGGIGFLHAPMLTALGNNCVTVACQSVPTPR